MTIISLIISVFLIGGTFLFVNYSGSGETKIEENNVYVAEGRQVIEISAKGGYSPRVSAARAGLSSVIKIKTDGTFDCTAFINIPSINYQKILPSSGVTDIEIPAQEPGTTLQGLCGMGMFNFQVRFN